MNPMTISEVSLQKRANSRRYWAWLTLTAIALVGCQHEKPHFSARGLPDLEHAARLTPVTLTNRIDPAWLTPATDLYTIGPGDKLEIDYLGETNLVTTITVGPDGKIYYNLLPGLDVWGLTMSEAKARLETEMAKYVREQPQISLVLRGVESRHVYVLGYVGTPGVYPLAAPMTLLEAVSLAGGPMSLSSYRQEAAAGASDQLADLRRSFVLRQGKLLPVDFERLIEKGDLSQNIYLEPDDFVYFPAATAKEVYVLGAVAQPHAVPYRRGMTVAAAVASAYGTINGAYLTHVAVVRGSLNHPEIAVVNYRRVIRGEEFDIALQPQDIVYVPFSPYRFLTRYAQLIVDTFVGSVAINGGASLVGVPHNGSAGIFIPIGSGVRIIPPVSPPPLQ
jgi:polysaccharide export outer membrane protein